MYVEGAPALNRVRWSHSGKEIATGDSEGQVQVYDVGEVRFHPVCFGYFCMGFTPYIQVLILFAVTLPECTVLCLSAANLRAQG